MRLFLILIIFYLYNFYILGNTLFRPNNNNKMEFCPLSIFESFYGPIRSIYLLLLYSDLTAVSYYLIFELTNIASPYFYIIIYLIFKKYLNKQKII